MSAANDFRYKPHTVVWRQRLEKAMLDDELGSNRVKEAHAREDAYLEQQVRQADEGRIANEAVVASAAPGAAVIDQPMQGQEGSDKQMKWEERLNENDFHDTVNDDTDMYDAINGIPMDSEDMADQVLGAVQNHVSEVWSPPRVTRLAEKHRIKGRICI